MATSLCSTITNTAQWFIQLSLFSASKHFWNLPHFSSSIIAGTYQGLPVDKFLASQGKTAQLFYWATCPRSSAGSGNFWELPSCVFTELTYILRGFQSVPLVFRSFQTLGVSEFGMCIQTAEKPQIPMGKGAPVWTQTGIPWLMELHHHPHRRWRKTSLPWLRQPLWEWRTCQDLLSHMSQTCHLCSARLHISPVPPDRERHTG